MGIITVIHDRYVVSKEFVETEESLSSRHCMPEYVRVLRGQARLVTIVPKELAGETFTRMLELNNWWLFYYMVFLYDQEGNIKRVDRRTWCELTGRPYDPQKCAYSPEIV